MTNDEVRRLVEELDRIDVKNAGAALTVADSVLLKAAPPAVQEAYGRVVNRVVARATA